MKTIAILLLVAAAVMSSSAEQSGNPEEPTGLFRRQMKCHHPRALCQPATQPPIITPDRSDSTANEDHVLSDPIPQKPTGHRQKRGGGVPIIACNRTTGKCMRI